jgi:LacI family gluconate utilization system Gnt-I transcriptional repressor
MTTDMLMRSPDLDFLYFSNDMIGAGGLLHLLKQKADIPQKIGLAGFNGVELLQGLPLQLATMDACRLQIGRQAAQIICDRISGALTLGEKIVELTPMLSPGDTLRSA